MPDELSASLVSWSQNKGSSGTGGRPNAGKPTQQAVTRPTQQTTNDVTPATSAAVAQQQGL